MGHDGETVSPFFQYDEIFGQKMYGEAGDGAVVTTVSDMKKFAVFVLRKGKVVGGGGGDPKTVKTLISEENWEKWAMTNWIPGDKTAEEAWKVWGPKWSWTGPGAAAGVAAGHPRRQRRRASRRPTEYGPGHSGARYQF